MRNHEDVLSFMDQVMLLLEQFKALLLEEKSVLEKNKFNDHPQINFEKEKLIRSLEAIYLQFIPSEMNKNAFIQQSISMLSIDKKSNAIKKWDSLLCLSSECEAQNAVNGLLIMASKNMNERILDIITQRDTNRTYSKTAQTEASIESTKSKRI